MAHHTHSVQRRLSVYECNITIKEMSFYYIPWLEFFKACFLGFISYLFLFSIRSYDIICSGIFCWSIFYKSFKVFHVPSSDHFRNSEFHSNKFRQSYFINTNERVWRNNSSSTEVRSFSCKVMPNSSFFAFDPFSKCFQRLPTSMSCRRQLRNIVIKECGNMILQ